MSRAQRILAVIVGLITGVLLMESYGGHGRGRPGWRPGHPRAVATGHRVPGPGHGGQRAGGQAARHRAGLLLIASVALSTLLQVAVAPPSLVGYLTAGATPVWLLGSFAVLSLLYRTNTSCQGRYHNRL